MRTTPAISRSRPARWRSIEVALDSIDFGLHQHAAGGRRHFHAVAMAVEQLGAQPALERLDASTDRRLLGVQLGCGGAEAAGFCDGQEKTHIVPVAENIRDFALAGVSE